jgi:hypothetical protein
MTQNTFQGQTIPSVQEYRIALRAIEHKMTMNHRRMLEIHYEAPDHQITASELASEVGYKNFRGANLQYGKLADMLCKELHRNFNYRVNILATFIPPEQSPSEEWIFIMQPNLVAALEELRWV